MFNLYLSPIASNHTTEVSVNGYKLTYNGQVFDFSSLKNGEQVEAERPAIDTIKRENDIVYLSIQYHYDSSLAEPIQSTNKDDYMVTIANGVVPSPIVWKPEEEVDEDV